MRGVDHWEFEDEKRRKRAELATRVASLPPDPPPGLRPGSADVAAGFFARGGECEGLGRLRGASGALQESLRVTSGYRREASDPRPDCERCHGEGRVLDRTSLHGPRWELCPVCRWEPAGRPLRITAPNGRSAVATVTDVTLPPPTHPAISISLLEARGLWSRPPVIFDELQRWRSPWWARAIAWGIAIYYAVGGSRPGTQ